MGQVPCGSDAPAARRRTMLTLQLAGDPSGERSHAWHRGVTCPGMRCRGVRAASLGAAGKAPCREEALRLSTGSAAASVPPPPPGASSCPVRRDLPPEQEKRNESDGAHGPPAPPGGEGVAAQHRSSPGWLPLREQDTPPGTEHLPIAPAFQGWGSMTSPYLPRRFMGTYFSLKMAGEWGMGKSTLPSTGQSAQLHHFALGICRGS